MAVSPSASPATVAATPRPSPILAAIDRMMAAPPAEKKIVAPPPTATGPVITDSVARMDTNRGNASKSAADPFDETVERIRSVFKGEIVP